MRANHSLASYRAESRSGGALGRRLNNLARRDLARPTGPVSILFFEGKEISYATSIYDAKEQVRRGFHE
jgi:hypothetical protein